MGRKEAKELIRLTNRFHDVMEELILEQKNLVKSEKQILSFTSSVKAKNVKDCITMKTKENLIHATTTAKVFKAILPPHYRSIGPI